MPRCNCDKRFWRNLIRNEFRLAKFLPLHQDYRLFVFTPVSWYIAESYMLNNVLLFSLQFSLLVKTKILVGHHGLIGQTVIPRTTDIHQFTVACFLPTKIPNKVTIIGGYKI